MKQILFSLLFIALTPCIQAQVKVYNLQTGVFAWPVNAFRSGNNILVAHGVNFSDDFAMAVVDSNGFIINNFVYGSAAAMEEPLKARQLSNGDIIMTGLNFWDSTQNTNIGNYKGYAMVIDSFGNFKREFQVKNKTTYLNKNTNALLLDNYYYFSGMNVDSSEINPPIGRYYLCKTDTFGNMIWFKTYPQFALSASQEGEALEFSFDKQHILVGTGIIDSVVGTNYYYSYFMMRLDTAGSFQARIGIPTLSCCIGQPGTRTIKEISRIHQNKYMVSCSRHYITLDSAYNVIDSFDVAQSYYNADFARESLYDQSIIVGGFKAFGKLYNNTEVFGRDFTNFPFIVKVADVIPTYDGGLFAVNLHMGAASYIKMDCDGNYVNPINCWPVQVSDESTNDIRFNYSGGTISVEHQLDKSIIISLFDMQGRRINEYEAKRGFSSFQILDNASGIYILSLQDGDKLIATKKISLY